MIKINRIADNIYIHAVQIFRALLETSHFNDVQTYNRIFKKISYKKNKKSFRLRLQLLANKVEITGSKVDGAPAPYFSGG